MPTITSPTFNLPGTAANGFVAGSEALGATTSRFVAAEAITAHARYAFYDKSTGTYTGAGVWGHSSYATGFTATGAAAIDHHHAFQDNSNYTGTGSIARHASFYGAADHSGTGTMTVYANFYGAAPASTGPITTAYGVYLAGSASRASTNWAFYSAGTAPSRLGGSLTIQDAGYLYWEGRSLMRSPVDGQVTLLNAAETGFTRLNFGGITSSFPTIKRSGAAIEFKVADDTAYATIYAANIGALGAAAAVGPGEVSYGGTTQTTVGAAGAASALPANPTGYIIVNVAGTNRVIPFYTAV